MKFPAQGDLMHTTVKFTHHVKWVEATVDIFPAAVGKYHAPVVGGHHGVALLPISEWHYTATRPFVSRIIGNSSQPNGESLGKVKILQDN
jgi:hypothetical protein